MGRVRSIAPVINVLVLRMGWTAYYQVIRETPLSEVEIAQVADLIRRQRKQPWDAEPFRVSIARTPRADRVIADGWNKLSMDSDSSDSALLENALGELERLLGGELRIADDFGTFKSKAAPVRVPHGELVDPTEVVAAAPVVVASSELPALLGALSDTEDEVQRKQVHAQIDARDAHDVVTAIYSRYASLGRDHEVRNALWRALDRLDDPASVAREFLAVWTAPNGTYYYGDMPMPERFSAGIGRVPAVVAQLVADLAAIDGAGDSEIPYRRAEAAFRVLVRAGQLRPVIEAIRARRQQTMEWRVRSYAFEAPHRMLAEHGDARVVPTLLHFIGSAKKFGLEKSVMSGLVKVAPDRVRPYVLAFARKGLHREPCIEWLRALGGADEQALATQLAAHAQAPLYERAVDVDLDTRHAALRALADRADPSTFKSLVLAEALDRYLRARTDYPGLPFSWHDWKAIPRDVASSTTVEKLAWLEGRGATKLGEQVMWPHVAAIAELGAAKVAERYPAETLDFDAETLAELEREETAILAQL